MYSILHSRLVLYVELPDYQPDKQPLTVPQHTTDRPLQTVLLADRTILLTGYTPILPGEEEVTDRLSSLCTQLTLTQLAITQVVHISLRTGN